MNARRRNRSHRHEDNAHGCDRAGNGKRAQPEPQRLRYRTDEIDWIVADKSEDGAGAEDEDKCDDWRRDNNGAADTARRLACSTAQTAAIPKSTPRSPLH